jgi:NTP pyrophosphatase (non-canonical NTP hydrolase)
MEKEVKTLNQLRDEIHANAVYFGFYELEQSAPETATTEVIRHALFAQKIALVHSEISEALEAHRNERWADMEEWTDFEERCPEVNFSHENYVAIFKHNFQSIIKDTVEDELADVIIRVLDLCGNLNIDIEKHVELKMKYNKKREYKHGKNY